MNAVSLIISIVALLVSIFVAWKNYLSPFSVRIYSGNPRLEPCPLNLLGGGQIMRFTVVLPLHIVNKGAQDGLIHDIILEVHKDESDWLFYPAFYCDYSVSTELTLGESLTKKPTNVPFYPMHLKGREALYKSIIFVPDGANKNFPLGSNKLSSGKYHFSVAMWETNKDEYREKLTFDITLNDEQIKDFISTAGQKFLIPFADEVKNNRQNFGQLHLNN